MNSNLIAEKIKNIKELIERFINEGKLDLAKEYISKYEQLINNDIEIYSMKAVINIIDKRYDEAQIILEEALLINSKNTDVLYNLAHINNLKNNYNLALRYYRNAYLYSVDNDFKFIIERDIENICIRNNLNINIKEYLSDDIQFAPRVLVLCSFYSIFTKEYIESMFNYYGFKFDILTMDKTYYKSVNNMSINDIYIYHNLEEIINILASSKEYDIIHIHFLTPFYGDIVQLIRNRCRKLVITIWGSDFYRTTNEQKKNQRSLINLANTITFANKVTMEQFIQYFGAKVEEKLSINLFGLTSLEYIKKLSSVDVNIIKEEFNIPKDTIIVTCGYNANPAHNHLQIINSITAYEGRLPQNIFLLFPMTYGGDLNYINAVRESLANSNFSFKIFDKFLKTEDVAKLIRISDILIQVQTTDVLSATMQEHLYNGNIVITGKWLPYMPLKERGVYFREVSEVSEVGKELLEILKQKDSLKQKCSINKKLIWELSSWSNTIEKWNEIYTNINDNQK